MGEAELFELQLEDWKSLASLLFSPAVAMVAIYLFGVDLTKLPFIPAEIPYRPPVSFVRAAAILLSFLFTLSMSVWLTLRVYAGPLPDVESFMHQFFRALSSEEVQWQSQANAVGVNKGRISLLEYDGYSDLRVYVNSVRIFGTHIDCMLVSQCNLLPIYREFSLNSNSTNYIEIFLNNSGIGDCNVSLGVELFAPSGGSFSNVFHVTSERSDFHRYETIPEYSSYRTCDQIRLVIGQSIPMGARKTRKLPNDARARVLSVVITLVAGGVFGTMLAVGWGQNFRPRSLSVDRLGIIHRVALPDGVKTRDDVRDFDVELTPADDFAESQSTIIGL